MILGRDIGLMGTDGKIEVSIYRIKIAVPPNSKYRYNSAV
jgi:hypothetical protein